MAKAKRVEAKKIKFKFEAPGAEEVMLAGDFNNWDYTATPLKKSKGTLWQREVALKPGRYEYRFVVDGGWVTDPNNNNRVWNGLGTENSVLEL